MLLFVTVSDLLIELSLPFVFVLFVAVASVSIPFFAVSVDFLLKIGLDPPIFLMRFLRVLGFSNKGDSLLNRKNLY